MTELHLHFHLEPDPRIDAILSKLNQLQGDVMTDFSTMQDEISQNTDVTASARDLLGRLADEIRAAAGDQTKLDALAADLDANTQSLADAVTANTGGGTGAPGGTPVEPSPT